MINYNVLLNDLLDQKLEVNFNGGLFKSNYAEGDLFELWRELNKNSTKYPIIWLQSGYEVEESSIFGNRFITLNNLKFFIITKGDTNDYYKKRYKTTFNDILYVLKDKLINTLKVTGFILSDNFSHVTFPFNDMSEANISGMKVKPQTSTIEAIWDALYLNIPSLQINSDCFKEYLIKK